MNQFQVKLHTPIKQTKVKQRKTLNARRGVH